MSTGEPETRKEGKSAGDSEHPTSAPSSTEESRESGSDVSENAGKASGDDSKSQDLERPSEKGNDKSSESSTASRKRPQTEEEINAPSRQTLIMLAVICLVTLTCWAAGRAACNYHPPRENQTPRKVSLEDKTRSSKDTGIEFGLALASGDFATAEKLAVGEALEFVNQEKSSCDDCTARKKAAEKLLGRGVVHRANSVDAIVEVTIQGAPSGKSVRTLGVERKGRDFRVSRIFSSPSDAELLPAPEPQGPAELPAVEAVEGTDDEDSEARSDSDERPAGPDAKPAVED